MLIQECDAANPGGQSFLLLFLFLFLATGQVCWVRRCVPRPCHVRVVVGAGPVASS